MDLGIKVFRNCKLFKGVTSMSILKSGKIKTFYETIMIDNFDIFKYESDVRKGMMGIKEGERGWKSSPHMS